VTTRKESAPTPGELAELTRELVPKVQTFLAASARAAELSQTEFWALARAVRTGGVTGIELRQLLGLTSSSVTELADRLERRGFIERRRSSSDRRLTILAPTPPGKELIAELAADVMAKVAKAAERVPDRDRARLRRYVRDVGRALDEAKVHGCE